MNSLKLTGHLRAFTAFSILLASINGMAFAPAAFADGDQSSGGSDLNFGGAQKWSIVPSGTPDPKPSERRTSESSFVQPGSSSSFTPLPPASVPKSNWSMSPSGNGNTQSSVSSDASASKPLK